MSGLRRYSRDILRGIGIAIFNIILVVVFGLPLLWGVLLGVLEIVLLYTITNRLLARDQPGFDAMNLVPEIAAIAQGRMDQRAQVETKLAVLEQQGISLTHPVQSLWAGERDLAKLTAHTGEFETELIRRALFLLKAPSDT